MIKVRTLPLAIVVVVVLFGGIGISSLAGFWNVTTTKKPALIREGEYAGMPSPSDIRGSYTWNDVSDAFDIPVAEVTRAFGASSAADKVNTLEAIWLGKLPEGVEIGTDSVRLFVSLYTGLPHAGEEGTVLPESAIEVLRLSMKGDRGALEEAALKAVNATQASAVDGAAVAENPAPTEKTAPATTKPAPAPVATAAAETATGGTGTGSGAVSTAATATHSSVSLTGKTTFRDLEKAGYDMSTVEAIVGPITDLDQTIKAWSDAAGIEYSAIKEKIAKL